MLHHYIYYTQQVNLDNVDGFITLCLNTVIIKVSALFA